MIRQDVMTLPGFNFEKYKQLRESNLSIISQNCFGGFLGLPFLSPTINLSMNFSSFFSLISNLKENVKNRLIFDSIRIGAHKIIIPIYLLGNDVKLNMVHYNNFDEAEEKWYKRVKRINWNNLLMVTFTESEEEAEMFDLLPYNKKVCFVPFKSNLQSAFYLPFINNNDTKLYQYVLGLARGNYPFYEMWDLMLYGKKTPRMDLDLL